MPRALLALAVSCFCIGTSEFAVIGLLPQMAADLSVSIPAAGQLVTAYALGVVIGAPLLSATTTRFRRRDVLVALLVLFLVGSVLCAVAPTYELLLVGRVIAALTQGGFHGAGVVVASDMVAPEKRGQAISLMFTGFTVSNLVGVPASTAVGQALGWRAAFWTIAVAGLLSLVILVAMVPRQDARPSPGLRRELAVFRRPSVWLGLAATALGFSAAFTSFTYLAPLLIDVGGFAPAVIPILLAVFGIGLVAGNIVGGRLSDRALWPSVVGTLLALAVISALLMLTIHNPVTAVISVFLLGAAALSTVTPLQAQIVAAAADAPVLASAANISAFNLGNALGAYLGGAVIAAGFGYSATNGLGALLAAGGVVVALIAAVGSRRRATAETPS